ILAPAPSPPETGSCRAQRCTFFHEVDNFVTTLVRNAQEGFMRAFVPALSATTLALASALLGGCSGAENDSTVSAYIQSSDGKTTAWPSASIEVCWEPSSPSFTDDFATMARTALTTEYAKAGITFTGWNKCTDSSRSLRVLVDDNVRIPYTKTYGH